MNPQQYRPTNEGRAKATAYLMLAYLTVGSGNDRAAIRAARHNGVAEYAKDIQDLVTRWVDHIDDIAQSIALLDIVELVQPDGWDYQIHYVPRIHLYRGGIRPDGLEMCFCAAGMQYPFLLTGIGAYWTTRGISPRVPHNAILKGHLESMPVPGQRKSPTWLQIEQCFEDRIDFEMSLWGGETVIARWTHGKVVHEARAIVATLNQETVTVVTTEESRSAAESFTPVPIATDLRIPLRVSKRWGQETNSVWPNF